MAVGPPSSVANDPTRTLVPGRTAAHDAANNYENHHAPGLWTLDSARATRRDQCGAGQVSERTQLTRPLFLLAMRIRTKATDAKVTDLQMRKVAKWLN